MIHGLEESPRIVVSQRFHGLSQPFPGLGVLFGKADGAGLAAADENGARRRPRLFARRDRLQPGEKRHLSERLDATRSRREVAWA